MGIECLYHHGELGGECGGLRGSPWVGLWWERLLEMCAGVLWVWVWCAFSCDVSGPVLQQVYESPQTYGGGEQPPGLQLHRDVLNQIFQILLLVYAALKYLCRIRLYVTMIQVLGAL